MTRYPIIAIEGIDGSGKSTVAGMIAKCIGGVCLHTPCDGYDAMKDYFKNCCESALPRFYFYVSSLWDAYLKAIKIVETGPVIFDRYTLSTSVYHKVLFRKCKIKFRIDEIAKTVFPPEADLNILLNVSTTVTETRLRNRQYSKYDTVLETDRKFQSKVSDLYIKSCPVIVEANSDDIRTVSNRCLKIIKDNFTNVNLKYA